MKTNKQNPYDIEIHISEIYDQQVNHTQDVDFIKNLALSNSCFKILEPFCGTGRILIPLAQCGLDLTGIDGSKVMVQKLLDKLQLKSNEMLHKPKIICSNALACKWEENYDLIILGANSFFELATLEEQKNLVMKAYDSLKEEGYLFIDNDNIENELPDYWCELGVEKEGFPSGTCDDDIQLKSYVKPVYVNKQLKIWRAERRMEVYENQKLIKEYKWVQQKHPIGYSEILKIVENLDMEIMNQWSGTSGDSFDSNSSKRATLWLQKGVK